MPLARPSCLAGAAGFVLLGALACDPLSHPAYQGEVLATLHGLAVVREGGRTPPPAELVLAWGAPGRDFSRFKHIAEKVPVTGNFPSEFKLELRTKPPRDLGVWHAGYRLDFSKIFAFERGVVKEGDDITDERLEDKLDRAYLGSAEESIFFLERDLPADHPFAIMLGGVTKAGFHLMDQIPLGWDEYRRRHQACIVVFGSDVCGDELMPPGPDHMGPNIEPVDVVEVPEGLERRIRIEIARRNLPPCPAPMSMSAGTGGAPGGPPPPDCGDTGAPQPAPAASKDAGVDARNAVEDGGRDAGAGS